jgi:hypothetical protein
MSFGQSLIYLVVLIFLPFFNFGKMYLDISSRTSGKRDFLTETFIPGPGMFCSIVFLSITTQKCSLGFSWSDLYNKIPSDLLPKYNNNEVPNVPEPVTSLYFFLMNIAVFSFLVWYVQIMLSFLIVQALMKFQVFRQHNSG